MAVLGLYWGFGSGAALFDNNGIIKAVSEERFSRVKNEDAFPMESISYCMKEISVDDVEAVALASNESSYWYHLKRKSKWTIDDYITEQNEFWKPVLLHGKVVDQKDFLKKCIDINQYPADYWQASIHDSKANETFTKKDRIRIVAESVGIPENKIKIIEHHRCHAYYGYHASPFKSESVLVMTIDGWGDGCNATINIFDKNGLCKRVFTTKDANIGRIYRYVTLILGMKPNEHEYKVMGLAPYASESMAQKAYDVFKSTLYVDGIDFKWKVKPTDSYFWFKEKLEGCRFDGIAAGMQKWVEELLCEWVKNAVELFEIPNVVLSGGVAMNIKANCEIAKLQEVASFFVPGAPSDESLSLGAALAHADDLRADDSRFICNELSTLYLGPYNTYESEKNAINDINNSNWQIIEDFSAEKIAQLLFEGNIIGRCAGRMEFGARSLCNRSILADPANISVVPKINKAIKNRDFWMPFAPVIIDSMADEYLVNPKGLTSEYMTIGFETTDKGWHDFPAGCHQADQSARPQILSKDKNPDVYEILEAFLKISKRGALLNTSFNLHGFPIVNTPEEAIHVFEKSDLDVLVLNNFLIKK